MIDTINGKRTNHYWLIAGGALLGAFAGYVASTSEGRRLYESLVQTLEDFSIEGPRLCQAVARAQAAAVNSWNVFLGGGPADVRSDLRGRAVGK